MQAPEGEKGESWAGLGQRGAAASGRIPACPLLPAQPLLRAAPQAEVPGTRLCHRVGPQPGSFMQSASLPKDGVAEDLILLH